MKNRFFPNLNFNSRVLALAVAAGVAATASIQLRGPVDPLDQALGICQFELERPSTSESERALLGVIETELLDAKWTLFDPLNGVDYAYFINTFGIPTELIKVAQDGPSYGSQYNGATPSEYWSKVQSYLPPSALDNLKPQDTNPQNRWYIASDQSALLEVDSSPATYCTFFAHADVFDLKRIEKLPNAEIQALKDYSYTHKSNPDADFDGGILYAFMVRGESFEDLLEADVPSVWRIDIRRGYKNDPIGAM